MSNYLKYLQSISSPKTFQRKVDYVKYNFGKFIISKRKSQKVVLEIGPGLGECLFYLNSNQIKNIDIIDNDPNIIKYLKSKYKIRRAFLVNNLEKIDKKLRQYDVIIMTQVLEHLETNLINFISILYKHLKKNGFLIITVPNMANPFSIYENFIDLTHKQAFTDNSLRQLVANCNLKNSKILIKNFDIPPYSIINIIRKIFQKSLHFFIFLFSIINGGCYSKFLTPNISLIIQKK